MDVIDRSADLRLAPDGLRATCFVSSYRNYALNLDALDEKAPQYFLGEGAIDLAYHPVLPLVACIRRSVGPELFDRETAKPQPGVLKCPAEDLRRAACRRLWFAADGKGLLLDVRAASGKCYLHRVELELSPADKDRLARRLPNMAALGRDLLVDGGPGNGTVPLARIDAFKSGRSQEMSAKEVGRLFTDSVVLVRSGPRSGTGFVVGESGYILTCAHCVREADGVSISYRSKDGTDIRLKDVPAKVVRIDHRKDLALLKIEGAAVLPAVRLGIGNDVESGERVTVISNPGVGPTVLDYTMTEGIISSARRRLGHQVLIQTSAAINPGSSGAPMFNSHGLVIGLVVLKANMERVGFAVPVSELGAFLAMTVKAIGSEGAIQRQWFSADYKHQMTAEYLGVHDGAVQLRRADGKEIAVPIARLSPQDVAFVRLLRPDAAGK
jgi:S1-C subfamily serine protease